MPKLRTGSLYPDWLLERRKRAEQALTSVVATCYLLGVSTRRMDKLVQTLGITGLSKSQVSVMARELDEHVEQFRTRRLDADLSRASDALRVARESSWRASLSVNLSLWRRSRPSKYASLAAGLAAT